MNEISSSDRSYIVYCTAPQPFSLDVQPDDGLLEAETCSWLAVTIIRFICVYIYIYIMKRAEDCIILYSPQPFSLDVQTNDGLLEAETCSWLAVNIIRYIRIYIYIYIYIYI